MSSVTQKIPNYIAGISEQPDELKFPGQVRDLLNCVPDVTKQLIKRPGSRFLNNVENSTTVEWFSYYRDEAEQYIGCVEQDGQVRIWNVVTQQEVGWEGGQTLDYLQHTDPDAIQFLTVNDFTFVTNREILPRMLPAGTAASNRSVQCYATRYTGGAASANNITTTNISGTGQDLTVNVVADGNDPGDITAVTINAAGGGYQNGDRFTIDGYPGAACVFLDDAQSPPEVPEGYAEVKILAYGREYAITLLNADGSEIGQATYSTPAAATTQISVDEVLTGWETGLQGFGFTTEIIGNGIYFTRGEEFSITILDTQLMNGFTDDVNSFDRLPYQCHDGMIVEVTNTDSTDEDNFFVRFNGDNGVSGVGVWEETVAPNLFIRFDPTRMPHQIRRNANGTFTGLEIPWTAMPSGDYDTNPLPSFINREDPTGDGFPINKMLLFRNRLCFLSQENVSTSQAGGFFDLFADSVLSLSPQDPIDIAASSNQPAVLFDGLEINNGLVLFGETQQYLLSSEDSAVGLTQDTVKLSSIANFLYDRQIRPVSMGTTLAFTNMGGSSFRCFEMAQIDLQGEPKASELTKVISLLLPNNLVSIADSKEGNLLMFATDDESRENEVWGYRYFNVGDERKQSAWFRWKAPGPVLYHTIMRDTYYAVIRVNDENKILAFDIKETENTALLNNDFRVHLDNRVTIDVDTANVTFNAATRTTTFDVPNNSIENFTALRILQAQPLIPVTTAQNVATTTVIGRGIGLTVNVTVDGNNLVNNVAINNAGTNYYNSDVFTIDGYPGVLVQYEHGQVYAYSLVDGDYDQVTVNAVGAQWRGTVDGDWRERDFIIGYLFDMSVLIPRFYKVVDANQVVRSDTRASLVIHRFNLEAGASGVFDVTLKRLGYDDYTETYYPIVADTYKANTPMIAESLTRIIPCYIRNKQLDVELHSRHPSPFTLFSISWEGDFSDKYYRSAK